MNISITDNGSIIHMQNEKMSYVIEIADQKYVIHRYFGKRIREWHNSGIPYYYKRGYNTTHSLGQYDLRFTNASFDEIGFEYPSRGAGDYRIPAISIQQSSGIQHVELMFKEAVILDQMPELKGLPSIDPANEKTKTLKIVCEDAAAGTKLEMYYSFFEDRAIVLRHQRLINTGNEPIVVKKLQSLSLELPSGEYDHLSLYGSHAKEGNISRFSLHHGIQKIESTRGSSSPQHQPFFALVEPKTDEYTGKAYGFHLIYSGNFTGSVEKDQFGAVRAVLGINPDGFAWKLNPGESFTTPQAVLNFSDAGLNGMSQNFHWLYQQHLIPERFRKGNRPILLNSWEAMYYDVTLEKIEKQAEMAKKAGIELFVLDDGWFRKGLSSTSPIGDWNCMESKLPGGIIHAAQIVHQKKLKFGLWFEPEAISTNSELYQNHPDWILAIDGYEPVEGRHEHLLDLTRKDVRTYIKDMLDSYLKDGMIDYVKWDMNRPLTQIDSAAWPSDQKGEIAHRYVLGLYEILSYLKEKYPNLLLETCSSGGARFDPGMLCYGAQNWTSDNTDAFDRLKIQSGMSLLYPPIIMGAHVSITPNHQTGRTTPLQTRYQIAHFANLGYELDLGAVSEDELDQIKKQTAQYKKERNLIFNGTFYRHQTKDPNYTMWSIAGVNQEDVLVLIAQGHYDPLTYRIPFPVEYLDEKADYLETKSRKIFGGDELKELGLMIPPVREDYHVYSFHFRKISEEPAYIRSNT